MYMIDAMTDVRLFRSILLTGQRACSGIRATTHATLRAHTGPTVGFTTLPGWAGNHHPLGHGKA